MPVLQGGGALMRGPILYLTGAALVCLIGVLSLCGWLLTESALAVHNVRPGLEQTAWTLRYLNDCKANRACLASQIEATTGSLKAAAAQSYQTSRSVEATARESLDLVRGLRTDTHDLLIEARGALHEATELERALRQDLDRITGTADATIAAVQAPFERLDTLLATADAQLAANGEVTQKTLQDIAGCRARPRCAVRGSERLDDAGACRRHIGAPRGVREIDRHCHAPLAREGKHAQDRNQQSAGPAEVHIPIPLP